MTQTQMTQNIELLNLIKIETLSIQTIRIYKLIKNYYHLNSVTEVLYSCEPHVPSAMLILFIKGIICQYGRSHHRIVQSNIIITCRV